MNFLLWNNALSSLTNASSGINSHLPPMSGLQSATNTSAANYLNTQQLIIPNNNLNLSPTRTEEKGSKSATNKSYMI
mgnify:CR=1 FL=1